MQRKNNYKEKLIHHVSFKKTFNRITKHFWAIKEFHSICDCVNTPMTLSLVGKNSDNSLTHRINILVATATRVIIVW